MSGGFLGVVSAETVSRQSACDASSPSGSSGFPSSGPPGNQFLGPLTGIAPGEVAVLTLKVPVGVTLSTGVLVIYADEESFTFMTPAGHGYAGFITFSGM
jgi:hypothetical protein